MGQTHWSSPTSRISDTDLWWKVPNGFSSEIILGARPVLTLG